jgi:hypothetical protein
MSLSRSPVPGTTGARHQQQTCGNGQTTVDFHGTNPLLMISLVLLDGLGRHRRCIAAAKGCLA